MPIIKTEILGSRLEINYEEKEYEKLINLINNFKTRLKDFPNNGRVNSSSIIFLAAIKAEDELLEIKNLLNESKTENKKIEEQKIIIEKLKKQIILLNDNIQNINSKKLSANNDNSEALINISKLEEEIEFIKNKIKETLNE